MNTTLDHPRQPAAEAGREAGSTDVPTRIGRNVDRDGTRGRRLIGASVLEVTREHWLGRPAIANAIVCLHASAGSGRQWGALVGDLGGRYTVHAWHPVRGELKRDFEVPKRGEVLLELRF